MTKSKKIETFLAQLRVWDDGVLKKEDAAQIQDVFDFVCKKCGEKAVKLATEFDKGGTCGHGTCVNEPTSLLTIKCLGCGAAVSIERS